MHCVVIMSIYRYKDTNDLPHITYRLNITQTVVRPKNRFHGVGLVPSPGLGGDSEFTKLKFHLPATGDNEQSQTHAYEPIRQPSLPG